MQDWLFKMKWPERRQNPARLTFTKKALMLINESRLRGIGYLIMATVFFVFFMLEMFFTWHDEHMILKVTLLTILHTIAIWEPTRFFILSLRKKFAGVSKVKKRVLILICIAIPYSVLVGVSRVFFEDRVNLWGVPVANVSAYFYLSGITLLFVLLEIAVYESIYFFSEWSRTKAEAEELKRMNVQMQMDSLKVQIQPHFLFNTLNTLIGLIEGDRNRAITFTEDLAYVYRYLLEANQSSLISLEDEMKFAKTYFSLLKTRYPEGLFLKEELGDSTDFQIPPLSLQILIENAVKHNTITKEKPLYITIRLLSEEGAMIVENNYQPKQGIQATGHGLQHLKKKFQLLSMPDMSIVNNGKTFLVNFPLIKKQSV